VFHVKLPCVLYSSCGGGGGLSWCLTYECGGLLIVIMLRFLLVKCTFPFSLNAHETSIQKHEAPGHVPGKLVYGHTTVAPRYFCLCFKYNE
jgi:hypothetical protein